MDRILIIMKKNNGHQGIICPFTGAFFHNMQTCLLVYTYNRSQVSVYRTIGPLVLLAHLSRRLTGELIVYPCSGVRRPSSVVVRRRPSSSVVHNFKDLLL